MKSHLILDIDRTLPDGSTQLVWRIYAEPTAQELIDMIEEEHNEAN